MRKIEDKQTEDLECGSRALLKCNYCIVRTVPCFRATYTTQSCDTHFVHHDTRRMTMTENGRASVSTSKSTATVASPDPSAASLVMPSTACTHELGVDTKERPQQNEPQQVSLFDGDMSAEFDVPDNDLIVGFPQRQTDSSSSSSSSSSPTPAEQAPPVAATPYQPTVVETTRSQQTETAWYQPAHELSQVLELGESTASLTIQDDNDDDDDVLVPFPAASPSTPRLVTAPLLDDTPVSNKSTLARMPSDISSPSLDLEFPHTRRRRSSAAATTARVLQNINATLAAEKEEQAQDNEGQGHYSTSMGNNNNNDDETNSLSGPNTRLQLDLDFPHVRQQQRRQSASEFTSLQDELDDSTTSTHSTSMEHAKAPSRLTLLQKSFSLSNVFGTNNANNRHGTFHGMASKLQTNSRWPSSLVAERNKTEQQSDEAHDPSVTIPEDLEICKRKPKQPLTAFEQEARDMYNAML